MLQESILDSRSNDSEEENEEEGETSGNFKKRHKSSSNKQKPKKIRGETISSRTSAAELTDSGKEVSEMIEQVNDIMLP